MLKVAGSPAPASSGPGPEVKPAPVIAGLVRLPSPGGRHCLPSARHHASCRSPRLRRYSWPAQGSRRQPIAYNSAKAWAERRLCVLRDKGSVELVILRPGIVTGPRSIWQTRFADELLAGNACWLDDGRAICNSIYVDNLVHAIHLALDATGADGRAFLIGDEETVTWADLYRPIAKALGFEIGRASCRERVL